MRTQPHFAPPPGPPPMWTPRLCAAGPDDWWRVTEAFELVAGYLATATEPTGRGRLFGRLVEMTARGKELRCWWQAAGPDELERAAIGLAWVKAAGTSTVRHLVLARPAGGSLR